METQIGQTAFVIDNSKKDEIRDSEQSFPLLLPVRPDTLNKQCTPISGAVIKDKDQNNKSYVSERREKGSCRETDKMPTGYNYIVDIKLEEEILIKGRISKKGVQSVRKRQHDAALQNTLQSEGRKRRCRSSSLKVGSQDIVTEKKCTSSLLEPEQKIQSFAKNAKNLKKNCQHPLIMRGLHKEMKTLKEKDGTSVIIGLGSDKVSGILQKSDSCSASESRPLQKTWNFRERIKPVWPEQKQDKSQRVKSSVPKLESTIQNLSLLKYRERKRVITSPKLQVDVKYPVRVRSTAVPHLSSKCTEGIEGLMKNARVSLVKPQEQKRKKENSFMELTDSKLQKGVKASNQNSQHLLESVANFEENKKCRSTVIEGINRMVTRALSKSKMYRSDGEKQSWKSEKGVTEILGCRQWILEEKMTREQMDCVPTEELLVTKTEGTNKESDGKDEIVTSTDLKKGIKTSRKDTLDILSIQYGKLPDTILNTSKDSSIETPLEQSVCLPITDSDEIKSNNSVSPYFWRETKIYCDAFFSVTNTKCPECFDIKVAEKKIGKNALVEYQGERLRWLPKQNVPPCSIKKIPVVKLFDCYYIKALLEPTGVKPTQSYKVHCGSLHVALDRGKSLSSRDMRQNDLSSSSNVIHAVKLVSQKDILVSKEMCQYSKKCQNGKRFRENKLSMDFKKPSKRLKMPEDLEESAVMKVLINGDISSEHGIPREDNTVAVDSSVISEKLNYGEPSALSLLDCVPDLSLEQPSQNQVDNLSSNGTANQEHFITYSSSIFEKSVVLKKEKNELKQIETFTDFNKMDENKSMVEAQDSEKSLISDSNTAACMKRKRTCEIKVNKAGSKQQLYNCQRAVPINGKNIWPRESCARTSLWVHKNHALNSERESLRGTDSVTKCRELEVHKPLAGSSKISAHKIECTIESPLSDCLLHVAKTCSAITGTENRFSDMESSKQSTPDTKLVKSKVILNSLGKEVKGKKNINIQNGTFADTRKKKTDNPKSSITKQEPVLKTLMTGTLSNFKIPLLKDKSDFRRLETARSSEKGTCNPSNNLENSLSVKKARIKETSSEENPIPQFQSEQMSFIPLQKKYTNQFNNDIPENTSKTRSICNTFERTSHENKLELPTLKAAAFFLSTGNTEKQMLNPILASETIDKVNFNSKLARDKDNICADILKAYEDDVLVIDVIEDDPDLFGDTDEQEGVYTKVHNTKNIYTGGFPEENLELKSESSQLPKSRHLKCIRDSFIQDYGTLKSDVNGDGLLIKVDEIKSEALSGISSIGGISESSLEDGQLTELDELTKVFDTVEKYELSEKLLAMQEQKTNVQDFAKIENTLTIEPLNCDQQLELPFPTVKAIVPQRQDTALKSWINDFRFPRKCPPLLSSTTNSYETWKVEKNSVTDLGLTFLPRGYCRYHFNSLNGCKRPNCRYWHVLVSGNEKLCSEIIKKYISIGEVVLLQRAVHIFTDYYKEGTTVDHLDSQMFHDLLTSLLQSSLLKELFHVVHTGIMIKILPTVDILLKMFEEVASMKVREVVPELSDIFCKLIDAGMVLECEHTGYITKLLNQLHVSNQEITILMSRFQGRHFHKASFCDFDSAVAEFQHCKEKSDWAKLGTLYTNAKRECKNLDNLEKYSLYVASILISSVKEEKPGIPFCEFAAAVNVDAHRDEGDMTSLGRIGISVMFSYYKIHQWSKAKKVLDMLHALKIHFTFLKGLLGQERLASRCHIVNVAVEIFLKCGSLDGALWVLRESEWIINTASWPCDRMDVLIRHNLLYAIASELMTKNRYGETFEVLRNLPGFQNTCDTLDVSQYSLLFNKLLNACSESRNIGISSIVVEFMLARNIPVEFNLLRALITALGRSCLWLKARTHYKSALALGCYPPPEGNLYRKLLLIPSYMTEVEMLLAIEIFLVSNASSIQSPGASNQILQIVLKRCESSNTRNNEEYQNAVERLIQAARISNPKLFIKHLTVNVNMEQVYSLEHTCVLKWLKENMKWAGKVWLF
ncbi:protein TOPAZ1 [Candoia aspera]|uniref:protein TOPAZ1 n=1 Tax=Candoia aspera TaxID=51853 RepID=UPI002FD7D63A